MSDKRKWRKSTVSDGNGGQCVQLADLGNGIGVRDSKDPQGPTLTFSRGEMLAFVQGVKAGEFDDLVS